jgi:methionyl-tRNA formyltransferase
MNAAQGEGELMRIALIGQSDFGKAVLEAFRERGDEVAGVFCRPQADGEAADPLSEAARALGVPLYRLPSLREAEARDALRALQVDLAVLAYVVQFVPQDFTAIPKHGTIQYHPSLLPRYRGPSGINWPIIRGDSVTGLSIFRPTDGLDEGPLLLQKRTDIGPDDTLGKVYFERLFPMGVAALLEASDLVLAGRAVETVQDEAQASYEGWCRAEEARIHWHTHIDLLYNLIRGCNPVPGAWTQFAGAKLEIFDVRKHAAQRFADFSGAIGTVTGIGENSFRVAVQGGQLEVLRVRYAGAKKIPASEFCAQLGLKLGTRIA